VLCVDSDDPYRSWLKAAAVAKWKPDSQFSGVVLSFKRVSNILKAEAYEPPRRDELSEDVERSLFDRVAEVSTGISELVSSASYDEVVARLLSLKGPIDAFFDGVMVMDPDATVRARRLSLLAAVRSVFLSMADFSRLTEAPQP
jgi:glycyl-tRNA synthetase beta chain